MSTELATDKLYIPFQKLGWIRSINLERNVVTATGIPEYDALILAGPKTVDFVSHCAKSV